MTSNPLCLSEFLVSLEEIHKNNPGFVGITLFRIEFFSSQRGCVNTSKVFYIIFISIINNRFITLKPLLITVWTPSDLEYHLCTLYRLAILYRVFIKYCVFP